ncbi:hypothetical protein HK23_00860 [Acetobacter malorum]|uniref:Uncharacterized protein n=1 Tax=Acetobacter malorum TaxID=178901 RepID=A0A1Y3GEU5_9PROT|nr:hypothetical protein HK23_00860 [Acetobacter malorum]
MLSLLKNPFVISYLLFLYIFFHLSHRWQRYFHFLDKTMQKNIIARLYMHFVVLICNPVSKVLLKNQKLHILHKMQLLTKIIHNNIDQNWQNGIYTNVYYCLVIESSTNIYFGKNFGSDRKTELILFHSNIYIL